MEERLLRTDIGGPFQLFEAASRHEAAYDLIHLCSLESVLYVVTAARLDSSDRGNVSQIAPEE